MDLRFHSVDGTATLRPLLDFLHRQDLGYPRYADWVQRTEAEVAAGYKHAVVCRSGARLLADVIWQPHKALPGIREVKNLRVDPAVRGRVALFLLRQAEVEGTGFQTLLCDVRAGQRAVLRLLLLAGWRPLGSSRGLYGDDQEDVLMLKTLQERTAAGLTVAARSLLR